MAKDPAFLFYPGDWLSGTMGMSLEEQGAYLYLLIFQFNNGKFTKAQAKQVLSICSTHVFENVIKKFTTDGTFFWKQRLFEEIEKRKKFSESRRNNAKSNSYKQKVDIPDVKNQKAYAEHMENEIENINENEIELNKQEEVKENTSTARAQELTTQQIQANANPLREKMGKWAYMAFEEMKHLLTTDKQGVLVKWLVHNKTKGYELGRQTISELIDHFLSQPTEKLRKDVDYSIRQNYTGIHSEPANNNQKNGPKLSEDRRAVARAILSGADPGDAYGAMAAARGTEQI